MENKIKQNLDLLNLVSNFEIEFENGNITYLEEKTLLQIIAFYENEYLSDKALEVVNIALNQYPFRSDFFIIKARLLLNIGEIKQALEILEHAQSIAPFENEIQLLKVRALALIKKFDDASDIIEELKGGATTSEKVDILVAESFIFEYMKDYISMYKVLSKAVLLDSSNEEAMERVWISVELSRKYQESVDLHKTIIDKDPYNYQAWYNLGHGYNCINEYDQAIEAMEYAFIINPDFESAYLDCADTCLQINNFSKALDIYLEANNRFGPSAELMVNIANCYINLKNDSTAKQWLIKAIKIDSYNDEAYFLLGECYSNEKVYYNAINAYHKAINLESRREEYYFGLAKAYQCVEDYNKATLNYQLATQTGPEDTFYWREYAKFLIKLGLTDEALLVLEEAEEFTYGADLMYCKAAIALLQKDRKLATEILEEALLDDPYQCDILFDLVPESKLDNEINAMVRYFSE